MHTVLTIAGSDSGAGAGIQADLKAISATGGYGLTVLVAITAQNTRGVTAALPLPTDLIAAQFEAVVEDFPVGAVKTGMLADEERTRLVASLLRDRGLPNVVVDPVMISKSGHSLLEAGAMTALREELLPLATVVTPNVHEAEFLSGLKIHGPDDAVRAGQRILELGPAAVLMKGGHFEESPATDVLVTREGITTFPGTYIESRNLHGTGCTFSAAIASYLAAGSKLVEAIERAKRYITGAIRHGPPLGGGARPTDHFFYLRAAVATRAEEFVVSGVEVR